MKRFRPSSVGPRVGGPRLPGLRVEAQGLAAEGAQALRVLRLSSVPGADEEGAVAGDEQPAAAMPTRDGRQARAQHLGASDRVEPGVELPRDDPDVLLAAGELPPLAGVDAAVLGEAGVDGQTHQPGLTRHPHPVAREAHFPRVAVRLEHREAGPVPLGEEETTLTDRSDVPRMVEVVRDRGHPQLGRGATLVIAGPGLLVRRARGARREHGEQADQDGEASGGGTEFAHAATLRGRPNTGEGRTVRRCGRARGTRPT